MAGPRRGATARESTHALLHYKHVPSVHCTAECTRLALGLHRCCLARGATVPCSAALQGSVAHTCAAYTARKFTYCAPPQKKKHHSAGRAGLALVGVAFLIATAIHLQGVLTLALMPLPRPHTQKTQCRSRRPGPRWRCFFDRDRHPAPGRAHVSMAQRLPAGAARHGCSQGAAVCVHTWPPGVHGWVSWLSIKMFIINSMSGRARCCHGPRKEQHIGDHCPAD